MVAGSHKSPGRFRRQPSFKLRQIRALKKGEIPGVGFFIIIQVHRVPDLDFVDVHPGKGSVIGQFVDVEIDRPKHLIGIAFVHKPLSHSQHVLDVLRGPRVMVCGEHPGERLDLP